MNTTRPAPSLTDPEHPVVARYVRSAVSARTAPTADLRDAAAYEAAHVARTAGLDTAALAGLVDAEVARVEVPEGTVHPIVDRATPVADLDDRALWVQCMAEDRELGYGVPDDDRFDALGAEVARRFGADATENTADHSIACHMSSDDLVRWATDNSEHLIGIATGRVVPGWRREDEYGVTARTHGTGCEGCDAAVESAATLARVRGAVGATYGDDEHRATVARD